MINNINKIGTKAIKLINDMMYDHVYLSFSNFKSTTRLVQLLVL